MAHSYDEESGLPRKRRPWLIPPRFRKLPTLFLILLAIFGFIAYSTTDYLHSFKVSRKPLTVIISSAEFEIPEVDFWIHGLLPHLKRRLNVQVVNSDTRHPLKVVDDSLIIAFKDVWRFMDSVKGQGAKNVGLLRIGDEQGTDSVGVYNGFSYVFRPYYFPSINAPPQSNSSEPDPLLSSTLVSRPVWIPNGWSVGVGPRPSHTLLSYDERDTFCFFAGSPRASKSIAGRERMRAALMHWDSVQSLKGVEKWRRSRCDVQWTPGFMGGERPLVYSARLGKTRYALCPAGESPETIRLYEALENNAIPIVVYEPWMAGAFGSDKPEDYPFIVLKDWEQVGITMERLMQEPDEVGLARQAASRQWWEALQARVGDNARMAVDKSFKARYKQAV